MSEKTSIEDLMTYPSFVRWIRDESTVTESAYWNAWMQEDEQHKALVKEAEFLLELDKKGLDREDIEHELSRLKQKIIRDQQHFRLAQRKKARTHFRQKGWAIAASILMIITFLGGLVVVTYNDANTRKQSLTMEQTVQEFQTGFGEKKILQLNDGSRIILNGNTKLRFDPRIQAGEDIGVWLEGEAYFDIVHYKEEQERFFTVHTRDGMVQVLGTEFVVNSFGEQTHTVLSKGKIRVIVQNDSLDQRAERILKPGDMARFARKDNMIDIQEVNPVIYTSWIEDKLVFENTPMKEVSTRIENTFGLEVVITDEALLNRSLSGSIRIPNIDVLNEALSKILNAEIRQRDGVLYIESKAAEEIRR